MPAVAVLILFVVSAIFLLYVKNSGLGNVSPPLSKFAVPASMYMVATFIGTYGAMAIAVVVISPLLLYSLLAQGHPGELFLSSLLDRPYFPLQSAVAFVLGYFVSEWFKEGRPVYVWAWPVAQVGIAVALFHPPGVMQSYWAEVWRTYFNWECGCSISLPQWTVMSPLYPSLAFSASAFLRGRIRFHQRIIPQPVQ